MAQTPLQTITEKPTRLITYGSRIYTSAFEIGPQLPSFNLPRRLFHWIYSVSLFTLVTLTLALISVTPIDVIVQTASATFSGVKLFIVIIVCVVFLLASFILYISRVYQHRVSMKDIPNHTVYALQRNDLPKQVYRNIEQKLQECREIRNRAQPLTRDGTINFPGISPPEYIQRRNTGNEGNLLPPNLHYGDVVRSFSDKFNILDNFSSPLNPAKNATFADIARDIIHDLFDAGKITTKQAPDLNKFLYLYEKFRFGYGLIKEQEMVEFLMECSLFSTCILNNYGTVFAVRRKKYQEVYPNSDYYSGGSEYSRRYSYSIQSSDSEESVLKLRGRYRRLSTSSEGSVIKQHLFDDQPRKQSVMFDLGTNNIYSKPHTRGSFSGYTSEEAPQEIDDDEYEDNDDTDIYKFRKKIPPQDLPTFHVEEVDHVSRSRLSSP